MRLHRRRSGMTLVEVVVALAVLSLVVLTLGASLRSMAGSAQRIDQRVDATDEMRVAVAFLGELLARASSTRGPGPDRAVLFGASAAQMTWVSIMPPRFGAAGRHALRLAVEPLADGRAALVLRYWPWPDDAVAFPDWSQAEARVLVRRVESFVLGYGGEGLEQAWPAGWTDKDRLPARVRFDLVAGATPWPAVVLPIRAPPATVGMGGFVIGGSTR